ncbi:MAG: hypothetical protein ACRDFA_10710 [bacterium]
MARITVTVQGDRRAGDWYYVSVTGRLSRRDLRRLERACGRAMEHCAPPLEIRIADPVDIDPPARFFLERLRARGAIVVGPRFPECH